MVDDHFSDYHRELIYKEFLSDSLIGKIEPDRPKLYYLGVKTSSYYNQINKFPIRLQQKPSPMEVSLFKNHDLESYPAKGTIPLINESELNFLHSDITEAILCIGGFKDGEFKTQWFGRNALIPVQCWSSTKFLALTHLVNKLTKSYPNLIFNDCYLRGVNHQEQFKKIPLIELAKDLYSYQNRYGTSNSLGLILKLFATQTDIETWLKEITGSQEITFQGGYGEPSFLNHPEIYHQPINKVILNSIVEQSWGKNLVSVYDLVRLMSMIGWHNYIPASSRITGLNLSGWEFLIKSSAFDSARLMDLAINKLGLAKQLDSVVILSKLGNGISDERDRTEAVYLVFTQFKQGSDFITFSLALRGAIKLTPRSPEQEVPVLDARMATEVTEILKWVLKK